MPAGDAHAGPSRRFVEEGYGVLERFLDDTLVEAVGREVEAALQAPPPAGCERPHNRLLPLRWNDPPVDLILEGEHRHRSLAALTQADDLRWISAYVSTKEARTPALWWHQDWWCWDHPISFGMAAPQVALLCYLSDTNEENGALRVLPRSHHASVPLHGLLPEAHAQDADVAPDHPALRAQPGQVTLSARPGDAVVLDYRLLHGTHANVAATRRDCLLLSFTPCWRELPTDLRAHLIRHLAQPRDDEQVPDTSSWEQLLPSFDGLRADLPLNRVAPSSFSVAD